MTASDMPPGDTSSGNTPPNSAPPSSSGVEPVSLLLVDDDARFRERMAQALRVRELQVTTAEGPESAREQLLASNFSCIVVDLKMPGVRGLEFVEQLRQEYPDIPLVVLTGYGTIATAVSAMRLGVRDYLVKPCNADQLHAAIVAPLEPGPLTDTDSDEAVLAEQIPSLARLEREHIERVLLECGGNVSKAARVLGIHRRTLQYKLLKFPASR